jgi:maltose/moltooligosaccharide transporter
MLSGSLPSNKMGYYMGVFFFIVIPISSCLHFRLLVSQFFNSEPIYALLIGGASMILAGLFLLPLLTIKNYNK